MTRHRLPPRRVSETHAIAFGSRNYLVTIGRYADGTVGEVFASGGREGADIEAMLSDACVLASIAMQHGVRPGELAHSMLRLPGLADAFGAGVAAASPVGAVVDLLARIEAGETADVGDAA